MTDEIFFRVLGVTGSALALGDKISAAPATAEGEEIEFYGILYVRRLPDL
ncbi:MAG: hypothetical protein U5Q03_03210 [Bacteroidota bacterium]|nr:hypothetical protein [Bacteroidota bacterium]